MTIDPADVNPVDLRIVLHPDPILRARTKAVDPSDVNVLAVANRMLELMHEAEGVGLAAPQVGLPWRLFVTNAGKVDDDTDRVYMNPTLTLKRGEGLSNPLTLHEEGCLSLPGIHADVRRPRWARIDATERNGDEFTFEDDGFLARVWQHEFDHLEGVMILDRMGPAAKIVNRRAIRDLERA